MCQLPTAANMPATRGKAETVSYANVMARLNENMSISQQIDIMMKEFNYSRAGASTYLKRNNIKNSGRQYKLSLYEVEKYVWADMNQSDKIKTIIAELNVTYSAAWNFVKHHPDCGRKAKHTDEIDVKKVESIAERPSDTKETVIADIKRTISEIEKLEEELESKKRLLKSMMYGYINLD